MNGRGWWRFKSCPDCGAATGQPCRDLRTHRAGRYEGKVLKRKHARRPWTAGYRYSRADLTEEDLADDL